MRVLFFERFFDVQSSKDIELKRKKFVLYFASYIGALIILFFAAKNYNPEYKTLAWILIISAVLILTNAIASHFSRNFKLSCYIGSTSIALLMLVLFFSGGYSNTALYWMYPFPLVFFTLLNHRVGLIFNLVLWASITTLLQFPELLYAEYRPESASRFSASLLITILIGFLSEYFRFRSHKELCDINFEKQQQANTDVLTGLPNRRFLESVYLKNMATDNQAATLVMADIDHFKKVNDTYGHDIGDQVLIHIAKILQQNIRKNDVAIRLGGEEFLLILPKTSIQNSHMVAEKIRSLIFSNPFKAGDITIDLSCSFGLSYCAHFNQFNQVLNEADNLLYDAKSAGRNCVKY